MRKISDDEKAYELQWVLWFSGLCLCCVSLVFCVAFGRCVWVCICLRCVLDFPDFLTAGVAAQSRMDWQPAGLLPHTRHRWTFPARGHGMPWFVQTCGARLVRDGLRPCTTGMLAGVGSFSDVGRGWWLLSGARCGLPFCEGVRRMSPLES